MVLFLLPVFLLFVYLLVWASLPVLFGDLLNVQTITVGSILNTIGEGQLLQKQ